MDYLNENLRVIASYDSFLVTRLLQVNCENVVFCVSEDGEQNLYLDDVRQWVHSLNSPIKEASDSIACHGLNGIDVLFVYGVGLGYHYDAVEKWLEEETSHYLVFLEDDLRILKRFLETEKAFRILQNSQVKVYFLGDFLEDKFFTVLAYNFLFAKIKVVALDYYYRVKHSKFDDLSGKLTRLFKAAVDEHLEYSAVDKFYSNFYSNMLELPKAYLGCGLHNKFYDIPAIICGPGPSLEKHLDVLQSLENKALLISGGSGINALVNHGIMPHFIAYLDPNPNQYGRFLISNAFEIPLFYRNRLNCKLVQSIHGKPLFINRCNGYPLATWVEEELGIVENCDLDSGLNVINWCLELAYYLGCNPITLIGMDLAFSGNKQYVGGVISKAFDGSYVLNSGRRGVRKQTSDIYGKEVFTQEKWINESLWIGKYAKQRYDRVFFNATEGGIGFPGVANVSLKEVIAKYCCREQDFLNFVHREIQYLKPVDVSKEQILDVFQKLLSSFAIVDELCDKMHEVIKTEILGSDSLTGQLQSLEGIIKQEVAYDTVIKKPLIAYEGYIRRCRDEVRRDMKFTKEQKGQEFSQLYVKKLNYLQKIAKDSITVLNQVMSNEL